MMCFATKDRKSPRRQGGSILGRTASVKCQVTGRDPLTAVPCPTPYIYLESLDLLFNFYWLPELGLRSTFDGALPTGGPFGGLSWRSMIHSASAFLKNQNRRDEMSNGIHTEQITINGWSVRAQLTNVKGFIGFMCGGQFFGDWVFGYKRMTVCPDAAIVNVSLSQWPENQICYLVGSTLNPDNCQEHTEYITECVVDQEIDVQVFCIDKSKAPTVAPSYLPSLSPTSAKPTTAPTKFPSLSPSVAPTLSPSVIPTNYPTVEDPTKAPSVNPTVNPTILPSVDPTISPSVDPTISPSVVPSVSPSVSPSLVPSTGPTFLPPRSPSTSPTYFPTTDQPSGPPTIHPSFSPSVTPTLLPSSADTLTVIYGVEANYYNIYFAFLIVHLFVLILAGMLGRCNKKHPILDGIFAIFLPSIFFGAEHLADFVLTYVIYDSNQLVFFLYICFFFLGMFHLSTAIWVFLNLRSGCITFMQLTPFLGTWQVYQRCTGEIFIFPLDKLHFVLLTFPFYFISLFYSLQVSGDVEWFVYVSLVLSSLSFSNAILTIDFHGFDRHASCVRFIMWLFRILELVFRSSLYLLLSWLTISDYVIAWVIVQVVILSGIKLSCPEEAGLSALARLHLALFHIVYIDLDMNLWMSWLTNLLKLLEFGGCGALWYLDDMPEPPFYLLATAAISFTLLIVLIPCLFCGHSFHYLKYREWRERRNLVSVRSRKRSSFRNSSFSVDSESGTSSPKRRKPEFKTQFRKPKVNDNNRSAEELARQGRSPSEILRKGWTVADLRNAGFSANEVTKLFEFSPLEASTLDRAPLPDSIWRG